MSEDTRPLAGLHPDREVRQRLHLAFVREFLPPLVFGDPRGFFAPCFLEGVDPTSMIRDHWLAMEKARGLGPTDRNPRTGEARRVADLTAGMEIIAGKPDLFVTLPTPERSPQSFFISIVLLAPPGDPHAWPADVQARYFTLDRFRDANAHALTVGAMTEWTEALRQGNWGLAVPVVREGFQASVAQTLAQPETARPDDGRYLREEPGMPAPQDKAGNHKGKLQ